MGTKRGEDQFYVIPTCILRPQIEASKEHYMGQTKRGGGNHVDLGMWTLHLDGNKEQLNHGYSEKWKTYLDNWASLDLATSSA
jgi:hypothetical protein